MPNGAPRPASRGPRLSRPAATGRERGGLRPRCLAARPPARRDLRPKASGAPTGPTAQPKTMFFQTPTLRAGAVVGGVVVVIGWW